jgi:hypothetical protein
VSAEQWLIALTGPTIMLSLSILYLALSNDKKGFLVMIAAVLMSAPICFWIALA